MKPLRVLVVDDSEDDALLVLRELQRAGYALEWERVQDAPSLRDALVRRTWDLVLSDWSMPDFSATSALAVVKESGLDLPFIMVSGTVGEETVVLALRAGAQDFVAKDKLARLAPAVERELREKEVRAAHRSVEEALRGAEKALRASEARFTRLAESGIVGIFIADTDGRITEANSAFLRMVGTSVEELQAGKVRSAAMTPEEWRPFDAAAAEQLKSDGFAKPWEKEYLRRDGTRVPVLIGMAVLEGSNTIAFVADLTDRKKAEEALRKTEEQLRHAQKMEAIGSLAGGVAHDFNNLLSIILSYSDLLLGGMKASDPSRADLEEIKNAGERAAALTKQLLAFSRRQMLEPQVVDLNETLAQIDRMVRRIIGEDIELRAVKGPGLWKVKVDPGQVEQVLMNLVVNARDAMPTGGKITIETTNVELDAAYARDHAGVTAGPHVMLAVSDTGTGMTEEIRARIFDPFFTTKGQGKGTGLGLSTVFGIVKQSGGSIWVYSEPAHGTTFKIYFPRSDEAGAKKTSRPSMRAVRGTETILLVEDEPQVRAVARTILAKSGYRVIEALDPTDALARCTAHDGKIHLLVTDVVMPQMSGRELSVRLTALRPEMRVLFMSGYTDNTIVHHGVLDAGVAFLQKPITPEGLVRKVREVLDTPRRE